MTVTIQEIVILVHIVIFVMEPLMVEYMTSHVIGIEVMFMKMRVLIFAVVFIIAGSTRLVQVKGDSGSEQILYKNQEMQVDKVWGKISNNTDIGHELAAQGTFDDVKENAIYLKRLELDLFDTSKEPGKITDYYNEDYGLIYIPAADGAGEKVICVYVAPDFSEIHLQGCINGADLCGYIIDKTELTETIKSQLVLEDIKDVSFCICEYANFSLAYIETSGDNYVVPYSLNTFEQPYVSGMLYNEDEFINIIKQEYGVNSSKNKDNYNNGGVNGGTDVKENLGKGYKIGIAVLVGFVLIFGSVALYRTKKNKNAQQ